ncbi:uncharacterized protein LOC110465487 [Mizuhopecten yessoensis]|uniref:Uncharacterized protein n=1 Tax=Mizuhopecten yessoensis TaxID=6573 RepID=A0A210PRH8_MIZYE|nr:uncharacterized protein LOC110465487 [Mizuhopecten yessoensis]OWF39091.1 hypothetical protein KP79_PYT08107 [Mizuhopecten yessoensis]
MVEVGPPVRKEKRLPWVPPASSKFDEWVSSIVIEKPGTGYNLKKGEKTWQYERRIQQESINAKSQYPPLNIEPFRYVRERLYGEDGRGMTPEHREMRARWVRDQQLAPEEPIYVPPPRNIFRRVFGKPWEVVYMAKYKIRNTLMFWTPPKVVPPRHANKLIPWTCFFYGLGLVVYYRLKYNPKNWENHSIGFEYQHVQPANFEGIDRVMEPYEYMDRGFSERKALLDLKTSGPRFS